LEVHLSFSAHDDEHEAEKEGAPQRNGEDVVSQFHGYSITNYHLKHALGILGPVHHHQRP